MTACCRVVEMRVVFVAYLLFIVAGLAWCLVVALVHH